MSLGEVVAITPLVKEWHRRHPDHRLIVSTVTETGREAVEQRLAGIAEHRYAPLDLPWAVSRTVARWRPALYLFVVYAIIKPFGAEAQAGFGIGGRIVQAGFMPAARTTFPHFSVSAATKAAKVAP